MDTIWRYLGYAPPLNTTANLSSITCIVTGANTGIGKHIACQLFKLGATVVLACRSEDKALAAIKDIQSDLPVYVKGGKITFLPLDLSDFESVNNFVTLFLRDNDKLNFLVNNAGLINTDCSKTKNNLNLTFQTNHLGPFLLTNLLVPILQKTFSTTKIPTRVIQISSLNHFVPGKFDTSDIKLDSISNIKGVQNGFILYGITKQMNIMMGRELNKRFASQGIISASCHPGVVMSEFASNLLINYGFLSTIFKLAFPFFLRSPVMGASPCLKLLVDCGVAEFGGGSSGYLDSNGAWKTPSAQCLDEGDCLRLWESSELLISEYLKKSN